VAYLRALFRNFLSGGREETSWFTHTIRCVQKLRETQIALMLRKPDLVLLACVLLCAFAIYAGVYACKRVHSCTFVCACVCVCLFVRVCSVQRGEIGLFASLHMKSSC
jgi:hypothetical protein